MKAKKLLGLLLFSSVSLLTATSHSLASSHREAPLITESPKLDGTDLYMFNSYESGRDGFVTILANYLPLQDSFGGPNYFTLSPNALYNIHIDNNGDALPDITFQFRFKNTRRNIAVSSAGVKTPIPLINVGPIGPGRDDTANLNVLETYSVKMIETGTAFQGYRLSSRVRFLTDRVTGTRQFKKPVDNIGVKSIPNYASYANAHIYDVNIPGCGSGRVFVGQRRESFVVSLGKVFDLINTNPLGPVDGNKNALAKKNITTLALEVPARCLTGKTKVIGAWTTAVKTSPLSRVAHSVALSGITRNGKCLTRQKSRLGNPLGNEVVIGLKDKDLFNCSRPREDAQFAAYVTNPSFPVLLQTLFNVQAPTNTPRNDLVAAFLTGVQGLNNTGSRPSEMLRLNTGIPAIPATEQSNLGVIGGDLAGFPNGRRPGDDVVDIIIRVAMGRLCHPITLSNGQILKLGLCQPGQAPVGLAELTDGALVKATDFSNSFPYLNTPLPGAKN